MENSQTEGSDGREETPAKVVTVRRKRVEPNLPEFRNLCLESKIHMFILLHNITRWKCSRGCVLSSLFKNMAGNLACDSKYLSGRKEAKLMRYIYFALLSFVLSQILNFV